MNVFFYYGGNKWMFWEINEKAKCKNKNKKTKQTKNKKLNKTKN